MNNKYNGKYTQWGKKSFDIKISLSFSSGRKIIGERKTYKK